jgi:hypothetical protein
MLHFSITDSRLISLLSDQAKFITIVPIYTMAPIVSSSAFLIGLHHARTIIAEHYLTIIGLVILVHLVYRRHLSPYRDIPGPFLATISPLWKLRSALNGTLHKDITDAHGKYGKIVRIAPDEVSISDPESIKTIYGHGSGFTKVVTTQKHI